MNINSPVEITEKTAKTYASSMREEWDELSDERKMHWRALAFRIYEMHCKNKLNGMTMALNEIEEVQLAPSTPKRWLPGVQEARNAIALMITEELDTLDVRVTVPESVPDAFDAIDPYLTLSAEDVDPYIGTESDLQCGYVHEDGWTCTREMHPMHWQHWDSNPAEFYEDTNGEILVTWFYDEDVTTVHPAVLEYEGPQEY